MRHLFLFILIFTNACGLKAQNYVQVRCDNDRLSIIDSKKKLQTLSCYTYRVENKTLILKSDSKSYVIRPNVTNKTINQLVDVVSNCACYDVNSSYIDAVESHLFDMQNNALLAKLKTFGVNIKFTNYNGSQLSTSFGLTEGYTYMTSIYIPKTISIDSVISYHSGVGVYTADKYNGIGVYKYEQDSFRLLAKTVNNGNMFKTSFATLTSPLEAPLVLNKGMYYFGYLYNHSAQTTAPSLYSMSTAVLTSAGIGNYLGPADFAANGLSSTGSGTSYDSLLINMPKSHMAFFGSALPIAFK